MRYKKLYPAVICFCVFLAAIGLVLGDPSTVLPGLWKIIVTEDALITDYVKIAGVSAALVNSALVTLVSLLLLYLSKEPPNGFTLVELGLMAGFSLFGKNIVNIWPIIAGTFLYAKARREPFGKYVSVSLLATALAPVVSYVALDNGFGNLWWGIAVGLLIGFVLPPLSAYTYKIQNGMNLYNMGFACGLLAMILVPVMSSMGANPTVAHHWAEGYNLHFAIFLGVLCLGLTVAGFFFSGRPAWAAWAGYRRLLRTTGRAPSDYLRMFGPAPVLINMGVNGLIGMAFILGVVIGGVFMHFDINQSSVQLALLFGTTLAPISGYFGWPFGIVAGFLHSSVVLHAGTPVEGINLYNNGFSGGLLAIVLYPIISEAIRHHRPGLQDRDYFDDTIEHDEPLVPPPARRK